jgi:hypothetical protein
MPRTRLDFDTAPSRHDPTIGGTGGVADALTECHPIHRPQRSPVSSTDRSHRQPRLPASDGFSAPTSRQPDRHRFTIECIDTEPLSVDQRRDAVSALVALIDRWTRAGETTTKTDTDGEATDSTDSTPRARKRRDHDL